MLIVEAMAHELKSRGVRYVFGIPGKESVRLGVELNRLGIEFWSARHETQAVMMADGYWRASGQIGVVLLAQGAGFANAVGGMACAAKARSGVLAIAGDLLKSGTADAKAKAIQNLKGVDPRIVCEGIGIRYIRPTSAPTLMAEFREALDLAQSGCAISLNVPSNLFSEPAADEGAVKGKGGGVTPAHETHLPEADAVDGVAEILATGFAVSRPVILAGRGAVRSGALPALRRLGEMTGSLLATSLAARSSFRGDPYDIGVCGTFSTSVATQLLAEADCILVFGASLNPFTTYGQTIFPKKAHVIQVDEDDAALGKYLDPELPIQADARMFAEQLVVALEQRGHEATGYRTEEVARMIADYDPRAEFNDQSADGYIDPRTLMALLNEMLPQRRLLVVDAGMHLHNAITFLEVERPEDFVFPIDSLAVGLGMGAAIGAAAAHPDLTTVFEAGDSGFLMGLGDLETAVRYRLPIIVVVSNDQAWGAEAQHLQMLGLPDDYVRMPTPSLAAVAEAMGAEGHTITSPDQLKELEKRLKEPLSGPVVLDCRVHPDIQPESFNFDYAGMFAK